MKKAMIFAAGLGTRLAPLTNDRPKALVELKGKPLLMHVIERLAGCGFDYIVINIHHFADKIIDYVASEEFKQYANSRGLQVKISDESDALLDTGGGLKNAEKLLFAEDKQPVLIHNVDIMSNAKLDTLYHAIGDDDAVLLVSDRKTSRYFLFDDEMRLVGWQNISTGEVRSPYSDIDANKYKRLAFSGIHIISGKMVEEMDEWPDKFGITDFYIKSCQKLKIRGVVQNGLNLIDIGKIDVLRTLEDSPKHIYNNV